MTVLLRNTQASPLSVPHEVTDLHGAPFVLRPSGEAGDAREVSDEAAAHPKLEACLRAGWLILDVPVTTEHPPAPPDASGAAPEPVNTASRISLPTVEDFVSDGLSRDASELLWAEACIAEALDVAGVSMPVARGVLSALTRHGAAHSVLRELGRIVAASPSGTDLLRPPPSPPPPKPPTPPPAQRIIVEDLNGGDRPSRRPA